VILFERREEASYTQGYSKLRNLLCELPVTFACKMASSAEPEIVLRVRYSPYTRKKNLNIGRSIRHWREKVLKPPSRCKVLPTLK
jgi:hypothetical protein